MRRKLDTFSAKLSPMAGNENNHNSHAWNGLYVDELHITMRYPLEVLHQELHVSTPIPISE